MKELEYCNSIKGECINCNKNRNLQKYCNFLFANHVSYAPMLLLIDHFYYNKKHIDDNIYDMLNYIESRFK